MGRTNGEHLVARWGRWRRLSDAEARQATEEWRHALKVRQSVHLVRISRHQVTNERGQRGCSLVGVVFDEDAARIYHTRALMAEDIVHELLHVAQPSWPEEAVVGETNRLLWRDSSILMPRQVTIPATDARTPAHGSSPEASPLPTIET
jgi:hypothetical protein